MRACVFLCVLLWRHDHMCDVHTSARHTRREIEPSVAVCLLPGVNACARVCVNLIMDLGVLKLRITQSLLRFGERIPGGTAFNQHNNNSQAASQPKKEKNSHTHINTEAHNRWNSLRMYSYIFFLCVTHALCVHYIL